MNKEIQVLRAIAILMVLFVHTGSVFPEKYFWIYTKLDGVFHTNIGVELFFVIAGYFLACSLDKYKDKSNTALTDLISFGAKKVKRLYKPVYFWAAVPFIMSVLTGNADIWLNPSLALQKMIATFSWVRNIEESGRESIFGYFWAVSLEFQTFIVYAAAYFFIGKKNAVKVSALICMLMLFWRPGGAHFWWFRFDPILYGVILQYVVKNYGDLSEISKKLSASKNVKIFVSAMLTLCLAATFNYSKQFVFAVPLIASSISAVMVIIALTNSNYFTSLPKPITCILVAIGDRSFSIFCSHVPAMILAHNLNIYIHANQYISCAMKIVFMIILAEFTYRVLDKK